MRLAGRARLGFYPLPVPEAERIRHWLRFPEKGCSVLDPCIGEGVALAKITPHQRVLRYGIELDAYRAEQARSLATEVIHGNCFDVKAPVESFSLIYLNPPYDFELGEQKSERMERLFLEHVYRWLKPGGVLILVVPALRVGECSAVLSIHFRDVRIYRLTEPESMRYKQVVLFGIRRTGQEKERLQDNDIRRARQWYISVTGDEARISPLPSKSDHQYEVPPGGPVRMTYRGQPLDLIEDLLQKSSAYRQAAPVLLAVQSDVSGRPLTPLHGGHVGLLCTAGMLNGIFGIGETRHIAHWQSVKLVDKTEGEEDGKTVIREKERFANELTLVFSTGDTPILK
jgi:SAM-dependent methyltransferase